MSGAKSSTCKIAKKPRRTVTAKLIHQCQNVSENQMVIIVFLNKRYGVLEIFHLSPLPFEFSLHCMEFDFLTLPEKSHRDIIIFFIQSYVPNGYWRCSFFKLSLFSLHTIHSISLCNTHLNQIIFELYIRKMTEQKTVEADINCVNGDMGVIFAEY